MTTALIVPAAGSGVRLGVGVPKALHTVAGEPILVHAVRAAVASGVVDVVAVAAPAAHVDLVREMVSDVVVGVSKGTVPVATGDASGDTAGRRAVDVVVVPGGADRRRSVAAALAALPAGVRTVLVHDAARCLTPPEVFAAVAKRVVAGADAVVPVLPLSDTVKQVDGDRVVATPDRASLRAVQTPQGFRHDVLVDAHAAVAEVVTDDAGMVERLGRPVYVVPGHVEAFKVTTSFDLELAAAVLARRDRVTT